MKLLKAKCLFTIAAQMEALQQVQPEIVTAQVRRMSDRESRPGRAEHTDSGTSGEHAPGKGKEKMDEQIESSSSDSDDHYVHPHE